MARAVAAAAVGRDFVLVGQHAVLVIPYQQCARVFRRFRGAFVAARDHHHVLAVGRGEYLVCINTAVHRALRHLGARREVGIDAIHLQRARRIERDEDVPRLLVERHVDGPRGQPYRIADGTQRTGLGVDLVRGDRVIGRTRPVGAGRRIQVAPAAMRPAILHDAAGRLDRIARGQRGVFDINIVVREHRPHVGIQRQLAGLALCSGNARDGNAGGSKRQKCSASGHGGSLDICRWFGLRLPSYARDWRRKSAHNMYSRGIHAVRLTPHTAVNSAAERDLG